MIENIAHAVENEFSSSSPHRMNLTPRNLFEKLEKYDEELLNVMSCRSGKCIKPDHLGYNKKQIISFD